MAYLRGEYVYTPAHATVLSGAPGDQAIYLINLSDHPVQVAGYSASCTCVTVTGLPLELGPMETKKVGINANSIYTQDVQVVFFLDEATQSTVPVNLTVLAGKL